MEKTGENEKNVSNQSLRSIRERSKLAQHIDIFLYKLYDSIQDKGVLTGKGKNTLFWEKDQEYWQLRRGIRVGGA